MVGSVALIPARGGSKRLPRKNIHPFLGRSKLVRTIEAAHKAELFDGVVVSTEHDEIAGLAEDWGDEVNYRDSTLATDTCPVSDVCQEFLTRMEAAGAIYDKMCVLYAAAPLRTAEDIRQTMALVEPGAGDFAMAVTQYDLPAHQALRRDSHGGLTPLCPDLVTARASEVGELLVDNGSTYVVNIAAFRSVREFYGPGLRGYVMPRARSVDVDEPDDLALLHFYAEQSGLLEQ